jgi:hypothetical protein
MFYVYWIFSIYLLTYMETLYRQAKYEIDKIQRIRQHLSNDIKCLEHKISILDNIAFSSEQDCRRKHQEIQELIAQKDRLEKLIANILNGEDYSKVNQIAKENVKAVLSNNKILLSVVFAAVIQTLKAHPEMANVIYNMSATPDGSRHDNNNDNNVIKYLELNKTRILDLGEKNMNTL